MFAPGAHHRPRHWPVHIHAPWPVLVSIGALLVVIATAAFLLSGSAITGSFSGPTGPTAASRMRTVAYLAAEPDHDVLYLRGLGASDSPRAIATFERTLDLNARGAAAPTGDRIAVVHVEGVPGGPAALTVVDLPSGMRTGIATEIDYLSNVAWSSTGAHLAFTRIEPGETPQKPRITVLDLDVASGEIAEVGRFDTAHQVAPIGYSPEGRMYVVVTDQSGSALWQLDGDRFVRVSGLSRGPTRDWVLSPDATRVAFVDRLGLGERSFAGRILTIATKTIADVPLAGDQLGAAWRPSSQLVDFGGPGGSLKLAEPRPGEDYIVPFSWSPDGSALAATVYSSRRDSGTEARESLELVVGSMRFPLTSETGSRFLGFVRDP